MINEDALRANLGAPEVMREQLQHLLELDFAFGDRGAPVCYSFSGGANEARVEVRLTDAVVGVRDSKITSGPAVSVPPSSWRAFVTNRTAPPR